MTENMSASESLIRQRILVKDHQLVVYLEHKKFRDPMQYIKFLTIQQYRKIPEFRNVQVEATQLCPSIIALIVSKNTTSFSPQKVKQYFFYLFKSMENLYPGHPCQLHIYRKTLYWCVLDAKNTDVSLFMLS